MASVWVDVDKTWELARERGASRTSNCISPVLNAHRSTIMRDVTMRASLPNKSLLPAGSPLIPHYNNETMLYGTLTLHLCSNNINDRRSVARARMRIVSLACRRTSVIPLAPMRNTSSLIARADKNSSTSQLRAVWYAVGTSLFECKTHQYDSQSVKNHQCYYECRF